MYVHFAQCEFKCNLILNLTWLTFIHLCVFSFMRTWQKVPAAFCYSVSASEWTQSFSWGVALVNPSVLPLRSANMPPVSGTSPPVLWFCHLPSFSFPSHLFLSPSLCSLQTENLTFQQVSCQTRFCPRGPNKVWQDRVHVQSHVIMCVCCPRCSGGLGGRQPSRSHLGANKAEKETLEKTRTLFYSKLFSHTLKISSLASPCEKIRARLPCLLFQSWLGPVCTEA